MYQHHMRDIMCNFLTSAGWIRGNIVLPKSHALREHLETTRSEYLKLRDVELPTGNVPFFALLRDAVSLIVPAPESERLYAGMGEGSSKRITCLMAAGLLEGNIALKKGVRVSDHIESRGSFIFMELCVLHSSTEETTLPVVIVNSKHIVGVTDSADLG